MLAVGGGDILFMGGVWTVVLVLGWFISWWFWNQSPLLVVLVGCGCVMVCAAGFGAFRGGGVAVGWGGSGEFSACSVAVVTTFALAAKHSIDTFVSHVTLFSTPETCWYISVV